MVVLQFANSPSKISSTGKSDDNCINVDLEGLLQKHNGTFGYRSYRGQLAAMINKANKNSENGPILQRGAEVGVFKGQLSQKMLQLVPDITQYTLVDSWRQLPGWNMPFNDNDNQKFEDIFQEAMKVTRDTYGQKVKVIRETSSVARDYVPDNSLDFVYIDGDHTAKGAVLDIMIWLAKVRCGGLILGDDYVDDKDPWGLGAENKYDPIMVKSPVDAIAEALRVHVYDLGSRNWAFVKPKT